MLRGGDVEELLELKREGLSVRQISRLTGYDRKTVQRYLLEPCLSKYGPRAKRVSKLDPHREYIEERLKAEDYRCAEAIIFRNVGEWWVI